MVSKQQYYNNPIDWLDVDNLEILPRQSHEQMLRLYSKSDIVAHFSSAEISPWTIFETMLSGTPLIAKELGLVQTIHQDKIEEAIQDFGMSTREFHKKWRGEYWTGEGDHFIHAETPWDLAEAILRLYDDGKERANLSLRGDSWIGKYWEPKDRGECIKNAIMG